MAERKSVLLRMQPALLERVDAARGLVDRTPFLNGLIEQALDARDEAPDDETSGVGWPD